MVAVAAILDGTKHRVLPHPGQQGQSRLEAATYEIAQEFGDMSHLRSNLRKIHELLERSALPETAFLVRLYEARAITRQQTMLPGRAASPRKKVPYMFTVLSDLLGLRHGTPHEQ